MLRADLAAAGVPYSVETVEGPKFADFHALRHTYLSSLAASGVGPKELQDLARHSDPRLTLGIYTHARPEALGAAAARLQLPGGPVNPLTAITREQLEAGLVLLAVLVSHLFAPPLAPTPETDRDSRTRARTKGRRKAAG